MTRNDWKTLWRYMRSNRRAGKIAQSEMVRHGGTYWTIKLISDGSGRGLELCPSAIKDRTISARIADCLKWARFYRVDAASFKRRGDWYVRHAAHAVRGSTECIFESRMIRLNASAFQGVRHV